MRPCGACRALVPADTGCQHWKPGRTAKAADSAERRRATREAVATLRRQMGIEPEPERPKPKRIRSREAMDRINEQRRERDRARRAEAPPKVRPRMATAAERVAEFTKAMGKDYR